MKNTASDLRKKGEEELEEMLASLQQQYFRRRFTSDPKRIQNPARYRIMRRDIARIKTILNERAAAATEDDED